MYVCMVRPACPAASIQPNYHGYGMLSYSNHKYIEHQVQSSFTSMYVCTSVSAILDREKESSKSTLPVTYMYSVIRVCCTMDFKNSNKAMRTFRKKVETEQKREVQLTKRRECERVSHSTKSA